MGEADKEWLMIRIGVKGLTRVVRDKGPQNSYSKGCHTA